MTTRYSQDQVTSAEGENPDHVESNAVITAESSDAQGTIGLWLGTTTSLHTQVRASKPRKLIWASAKYRVTFPILYSAPDKIQISMLGP